MNGKKAVKPLKTKAHGCLEKSIFCYDLNYLTEKLIHGFKANEAFWSLIVFLYPPSLVIKRDENLVLLDNPYNEL